MNSEKLADLDARALAVDLTLTQLADAASVSRATMARIRKHGMEVRPRVWSKLYATLSAIEAERSAS